MSALQQAMQMAWIVPTQHIEVPPALREAAPDLPAAFVVRMATADDISFVSESEDRAKTMAAMIETIAAASNSAEMADTLKAAAGLNGSPSRTFARQVEFILRCTTQPELDREEVLWLNRHFPAFFSSLSVAALNLSGEGAVLGKPPVSGETPSSEQP